MVNNDIEGRRATYTDAPALKADPPSPLRQQVSRPIMGKVHLKINFVGNVVLKRASPKHWEI